MQEGHDSRTGGEGLVMESAPDGERMELIALATKFQTPVCECRMQIVDELVRLRPGEHAVLMSEVGMGRERILKAVFEYLTAQNKVVWYIDYTKNSAIDLVSFTARKLRALKRTKNYFGESKYLLLDNVEVMDDGETERLVRLIEKMERELFTVIIGTLPEGEVLMEELMPSSANFWSHDLCLDESDITEADPRFWEFTHYIPSLASAYLRLKSHLRERPFETMSFAQAYTDIVISTQRTSIMSEERALMAAMLILGKGTTDDLIEVLGKLDTTLWATLARDEPLLGIDTADSTFCCVGHDTPSSLSCCLVFLKEALTPFSELLVSCCRLLAGRNNFGRSAVAAQLIEDMHARCKFTFQHGFSLMNAFGSKSVFEAYTFAARSGWLDMDGFRELSVSIKDFFMEGRMARGKCTQDAYTNTPRGRLAEISAAVRATLKKSAGDDLLRQVEGDHEEARALLSVGRALRMLFQADFSQAKELATDSSVAARGTVVGTAQASIAVACTYLLEGGLSQELRAIHNKALRSLGEAELTQLMLAEEAAIMIPQALFGHSRDARALRSVLETRVTAASRYSDRLLEAALLLALGALDVRESGPDRLRHAMVEVRNASALFQAAGAHALAAACNLIYLAMEATDALPLVEGDFVGLCGKDAELDQVIGVVKAALGFKERENPEGLGQKREPTKYLWLVSVLAHDLGQVSISIREALPESWLAALRRIRHARPGASPMAGDGHAWSEANLVSAYELNKFEKPIRINLLGEFEVYVAGRMVSPARFTSRRAKALLTVLGATKTHTLRRGEALESVFPRESITRAGKLLNLATSWINQAIREEGNFREEIKIVSSDKHSGIVRLDTNLCVLDVDLFDERARRIGDSRNDDEEVVSIAREIEELYRDDLCLPDRAGDSLLTDRDSELRCLFVDAMLLGSGSACAIVRYATACRFISQAYRQDSSREDVVVQLIKAYAEAGRLTQAERIYDEFVSIGDSQIRRPISNRLRSVAAAAFGAHKLLRLTQQDDSLKTVQVAIERVESVKKAGDGQGVKTQLA